MGIAGFFLWLQRYYGRAIVEIDPKLGDALAAAAAAQATVAVGEDGEDLDREPMADTVDGGGGGDGGDDMGSRKASDASNVDGGGRRRGRRPFPQFQPRKVKSVECDNLYLDMNGLIHPCCHDCAPRPDPESEDEMMTRIFEAVDKLVQLVKPRKILYMAIDGVAPRSKMNQQRARRFRSAAEREEANSIASRMADIVVQTHQLPRPDHKDKWDHNVITPATAFMDRVGTAVEWYVTKRLNSGDPLWKDLTVVLSDAHVPGEGEHKIMQYIRAARTQDGFDPNTRHMIHGQDADLIMLGLATHELHFSVLRNSLNDNFQPEPDKYCVLDVTAFRGLLRRDFNDLGAVDFERVVDDFVFLCFFIGNDFLPHMPLVDIKCRGVETMLDHYVKCHDQFGFLTDKGVINFDRLQVFVDGFASSRLDELVQLKEGAHKRVEQATDRMIKKVQEDREDIAKNLAALRPNDPKLAAQVGSRVFKLYVDIAKEQLRLVAGKYPMQFTYGEGNYRDEYYRARFGWDYTDPKTGRETKQSRDQFEVGVRSCVQEYLRGMQWVMKYYTSGCPSWEWFYPYHYAPLLQDVARYCFEINTAMTVGQPLHPVEQLLAVLPRESVDALPAELHTAVLDPKSVLAKFYPDDFTVDYTEAIHSWQGVIQLPFVNCRRLQKAVREVVKLDDDDGWTLIFTHADSAASKTIERFLGPTPAADTTSKTPAEMSAAARSKMRNVTAAVANVTPLAGKLGRFPFAAPVGSRLDCPDAGVAARDPAMGQPVERNQVCIYQCELPAFIDYQAQLLRGARLDSRDFQPRDDEGGEQRQPQRGPRRRDDEQQDDRRRPQPQQQQQRNIRPYDDRDDERHQQRRPQQPRAHYEHPHRRRDEDDYEDHRNEPPQHGRRGGYGESLPLPPPPIPEASGNDRRRPPRRRQQ